MDEELLIVEVQNHKLVYDPSNPFYKDNHKKDEAWKEIAEVVGVDADVCKAKWRSLRDSFVKHRKKSLPSGTAGGSQRDWKYSDIMSFPLPYLNPRSSKSNLGSTAADERSSTPLSVCGSNEQASACASATQDTQAVSSHPSTSGEMPHRSQSPREKRSRSDTRRSHRPRTSDVEERLLSILEEPLPKSHTDIDECHYFAMSIAPLLLRLDHNKRQQAKIGILNLLQNIESGTHQPPQQSPARINPPPTFRTLTAPVPGTFRPLPHPPPLNPIGPFTQMLAQADEELREGSTTYTDFE